MALPNATKSDPYLAPNGANVSDVRKRTNSNWNGNLFRDPVDYKNPGQNAGSGMAGSGNCIDCDGIKVPRNEGCIDPGSRSFTDGQIQRDAGSLHKLNTRDYPNPNYVSTDDSEP